MHRKQEKMIGRSTRAPRSAVASDDKTISRRPQVAQRKSVIRCLAFSLAMISGTSAPTRALASDSCLSYIDPEYEEEEGPYFTINAQDLMGTMIGTAMGIITVGVTYGVFWRQGISLYPIYTAELMVPVAIFTAIPSVFYHDVGIAALFTFLTTYASVTGAIMGLHSGIVLGRADPVLELLLPALGAGVGSSLAALAVSLILSQVVMDRGSLFYYGAMEDGY